MTTTELKDPGTTQNDESQNGTSIKKRSTRLEVGLQQQQQDRESFYKSLIAFNERRNTPIVRMPKISGEDVDLHKLYTEVISRGGWLKVNIRNEWEDISSEMGLSSKCVNAVVALKQMYCRYLDKYEKVYFLGEDPDRPDEPDDDDRQSRHKKWSEKSTPIVPMSYNYLQHNVSEQTRFTNKMSTDLYKHSEYEKLLLSLMSPLPNEQDFAINVCTLMANESKHTLKIENCPKLLDALIAHAGVFRHATMRQIFEEFYTKTRQHSLQAFWNDLLYKNPQIWELSYENSLDVNKINENKKLELASKETFEDGLNADFDVESEMDRIDFNKLEFLSLGRGLGTREYIGQRIQQISSIMRNLSFFEENIPIMAKNRTFIRFLVMCSNIRWGNLHHLALDVCGNIAMELELFDPTTDDLTRCLVSTLCDGIGSQDRGVIISCLEILNKLSQRDTNEDYLLKCLNQKIYGQMCLFLSLNDIMLLLYTLECIYSLSSLGSTPCNAFVQVKGIVDTLVSLITVEAQSYGPDGCILMRVVETVPGNMLPMVAQNIANLQNVTLGQLKQSQQQQIHLTQTENTQKMSNVTSGSSIQNTTGPQPQLQKQQLQQQQQSQPEPQMQKQQQQQTQQQPQQLAQQQQQLQHQQLLQQQQLQQQQQAQQQQQLAQQQPQLQQIQPHATSNPSTNRQNIQSQQSIAQENEQFATSWLNATLEIAPSIANRIEQQELYKLYVVAVAKSEKRGAVPQTHFPRIVRSIFGTHIGPTILKTSDAKGVETNMLYYVNLKFRTNPLPLKNLSQAAQTNHNQQQSIQQNTQLTQMNQPSQVSQQSHNQNLQNNCNTVSNKILNSSTTKQSNALSSSNNSVNNVNADGVFKPNVCTKLSTVTATSSSNVITHTHTDSSKSCNTNNKPQTVNAHVQNSNTSINSNCSNQSKIFLQRQPTVIIKKDCAKLEQSKTQTQQNLSNIPIIQRKNTVESLEKDPYDANPKNNNASISTTNEPIKVVKQNVIVTNNQIAMISKGPPTSLPKQIIANKNIKQNQNCTNQSKLPINQNVLQQKEEQKPMQSSLPQQQQQSQPQIQIQSQHTKQQNQFSPQNNVQQSQTVVNTMQKIHQNQILKPPALQQQPQPKLQPEVIQHQQSHQKIIGNVVITQHSGHVATKTTTIGQTQMTTTTHIPSTAGGSTAIIKTLLANKVTATPSNNNSNSLTNSKITTVATPQIGGSNGSIPTTCAVVKETIMSAVNANNSNYVITQNLNLHQLAQRQNLAKQKEVANHLHGTSANNINSSQKLSTTTISALVNNPIIQSTPVKVGQTTIKPINPHSIEKKVIQVPIENMETSSWDPVPPLAPIGASTIRSIIVPTSSLSTASEDSCNSVASSAMSASHVILNDDGESSLISFDGLLIPKSKSSASSIIEDDSSKDSTLKGSQFINANKMLVNLLDKKSPDPPTLSVGIKRKLADDNKNRKKPLIITQIEETEQNITPSKNAANLYAEMAASILEDEDLEDVIPTTKVSVNLNNSVASSIAVVSQKQHNPQQQQQTVQTVIKKPAESQKQIITMPLQRQIIVSPNVSHQQVILSQTPITVQASQPSQTITTSGMQQAALKSDSNLQTVPLILQKQIGPGGQQIIQQVLQQQSQTQTQYVLATNPQGQTYLVAQQAPQPQPTVLLTQSSTQNQQSGPTKTIIILQQQGAPPQAVAQQQIIAGGPGQPQKMIMTTPQGQQMIVTQVPRPPVQQIIVNQSGNVLPQNVVLTQTVLPQSASQPQTAIQQIQQAAQQPQLSPQLHIQQTILNQQNQSQAIIPQLTTNGTTLQIQQQTPHQQQPSILSQLPQIPATIKLHTPLPNTSTSQKSISQQQNVTTKVINKSGTPSISIVAQNPITPQTNSVQPQIIQQLVKPNVKPINSPLAKVTIQQQVQSAPLQQNITKSQINIQQQPIQTGQVIQKSQSNSISPQTFQPQKVQQVHNLNSSTTHQANSSQNQISLHQQQKCLIKTQKTQQPSLQPAASQHQNIVQQILAQNPSQTQIIQQSPPIQNTNSSGSTTQNKLNQSCTSVNSVQQSSVHGNSNQQINTIPNVNQQINSVNSVHQTNSVSSNQQTGQTQQSQSTTSQSINNNNSSSTASTSNNSSSILSNNSSGQSSSQQNPSAPPPPPPIQKIKGDEDIADINYVFVCDWRNCPRKKYKSVQEIYKHACQVHCPEGLDIGAEIYCQWGPGPGFCDNIPRKRFSLMTHLLDRHCTIESMKAAVQRRLVMGIPQPTHANPVTIIKSNEARGSTASPALSTSSSGSTPSGAVISAAMHAIKRHSNDFVNPKELMDENEGPVTKSIRLTASLILRNLVTYTDKAKRHIRQYEPHLAGVALSNVESSRTISQILYELNN